uniref:Uncharacterized protein n=1 Tax=Tanacetum cinerariifolium TaxID=118510 RepID=A0A6L2JKK8_TANCI|nr:hypothetical protein [Tanacetum cinerariifolium]
MTDTSSINEEDALPHDLAYYHDEDLANDVDDDDDMSVDVARGYGDDGGGDDRPLSRQILTGCQGKNFWIIGNPKTQQRRQESRQAEYLRGNYKPRVKEDYESMGPWKIRFEFNDKGTLMPLGDHVSQESKLLEEIVRKSIGFLKLTGRVTWKASDLDVPRASPWQIAFWLNPKNATRAAQNAKNRAKSKVICRQGSRSVVVLQDMQGSGANMPSGVPYTEDEIMAKREWRNDESGDDEDTGEDEDADGDEDS